MIYLDTSVALAQLRSESRRPPPTMWQQPLCSSRLLEYELWVRLHSRGEGKAHGDNANDLLARIALLEMSPPILARALEPFPVPVRTLDALHLSSILFVRERRREGVELASYDRRLLAAASALEIPVFPLD